MPSSIIARMARGANLGRFGSGAVYLELIAAQVAEQAFCHLGTSRVMGTAEEDALLHLLLLCAWDSVLDLSISSTARKRNRKPFVVRATDYRATSAPPTSMTLAPSSRLLIWPSPRNTHAHRIVRTALSLKSVVT